MNLVTNMAGKQRQQAPVESSSISASRNIPTRVRGICSKVAPAKRALYVPNHHHHHHSHSHSHQVDSKTKPNTNTSVRSISSPALEDVANLASGHSFRKTLPVVVEKPSVSVENGNHVAPNESTKNDWSTDGSCDKSKHFNCTSHGSRLYLNLNLNLNKELPERHLLTFYLDKSPHSLVA